MADDMKVVAGSIAVLFLLAVRYPADAQDDRDNKCHELIQELTAAALQQAFIETADVPDLVTARRLDSIYVLNVGDLDGCLLDQRALPNSSEQRFVLATRETMIEIEASLSEPGLTYVLMEAPMIFGSTGIIGSTGTVGISVSTLYADADKRGECSVRPQFVRTDRSWQFERWGIRRCR